MGQRMIRAGAMALLLASQGAAALPEKEFVCKVQTSRIMLGAVMVQAHDMDGAMKAAISGEATALDGSRDSVQSVLECVPFPEGRFMDSQFQAFVQGLPR